MFDFMVGAAVGMVVGWNFLPQPAVVAAWIAALKAKILG